MDNNEVEFILNGQINKDGRSKSIEPNEFFNIIKENVLIGTKEKFENELNTVINQIVKADKVGQVQYIKDLKQNYNNIYRELKLLEFNVNKYIYKDNLEKFIPKVTPMNSVKIIELERYTREIPDDIVSKIQLLKEQKLFDEYCIVYTDFSGKDNRSKEQKQMINRNKDPILFGYFTNETKTVHHDRFYFIADWIDEYCDLTFSKMIEKMGELKIDNTVHSLDNIKQIIDKYTIKEDKEGFFKRLIKRIKS